MLKGLMTETIGIAATLSDPTKEYDCPSIENETSTTDCEKTGANCTTITFEVREIT
jgi:hypothetical protein